MKSVFTVAASLLLLAGMAAPPVHAQHAHEHHAPAAAVVQEHPAQRYATDAPLRQGMEKIRVAFDALGDYEHGHMGPEQATALAGQIQEQVAYLIANCKLDPQADAALHGIIAQLSSGAQALKSRPADLTVIPPMREALVDYRNTFDDPGFTSGRPSTSRCRHPRGAAHSDRPALRCQTWAKD